ncbi:L,D-transpeptidase Cds6 family protein [Duganella radicis]|uniref:Tetratricopeptide repeat protein n=1 Tax=Duganella radicis TaxID=551988 RepID=A0A6L6PJJ5_9BURK|nr:tetratricopeptide repeat protein [Duganella radicis]MTV38771.1 tetratricopeptide repeat protein [Duganella radicis]
MKNKTAQTMLYCALALVAWAPAHADDYADVSKLAKAGKVVEALNKTNEYLSKHPSDPQMRFMKGVLLTEQNKSEEAIAVFTKLTEDYKDLPEPYNNLAVLYAANGQYDKARVALEKAIRTNPSYQTAYENLGDIYGKMASQAYDKALALGSATAVPAKSKLTMLRTFSTSTGGKFIGAETAVAQAPAPAPVAAPAAAPARPAASTQPPLISQLPPQNPAQANAPQRIPALSVSPPPATAPKVAATVGPIPAPATVAAKPVPTPAPVAVAAPAPAPAKPAPAAVVAAAPAAVKVMPTPAPAPAPVKVAAAPAPAPVAPPPVKAEPPKPAKPEPEKVAAKPDNSERDAVMAQVNGWAKAWTSQNVDAYLGYYSQQFEPPKGATRKAWADERRARIEGKGRIRVEVASPEVKVDGNTARVTFRQTYESDRLTARSRKTLVLVKNGGKWQIKQEISGN